MNVTPEEFIERMRELPNQEKNRIRRERADRARKRQEILLKIERLEMFRCDQCRDLEYNEYTSETFRCGCMAATEIRKLGNELDHLTSDVRVKEHNTINFTKEIMDMALKNGISYQTMYKRVVEKGWTEEKAATTPAEQQRRIIDWTDEMTDIVKRELKEGKVAREIWKKHFSSMMALRTFSNKTAEIRKEVTGSTDSRTLLTKENLADIRQMILDNTPRKVIREKYGHIKKSTMDWRITKMRQELKEEGLL